MSVPPAPENLPTASMQPGNGNSDASPIVPMSGGSGSERSGDWIGPYKLLERIGEGGFGTVWLAERREPIVQRVALKVIKQGMDTRAVVARFEQERQALAVMDHPFIAKVFDAGATPAGRPYFVMEHVAGEPITDYADRHNLSVRQRLELFAGVCEAVQHAHLKGIIHRDIKPSNILVSVRDGKPLPKVIDFGVAKAITHTLTEKTIFTEQGQFIGTPEYMSPEQAEMGATDIDTRTDVYSLGVVLYELLSGLLPFDARALRSAGFAAICKVLREQDPPKPSTRLSTTDAASGDDIARHRQAQREHLASELRRELDWIPLKALRKDRTERYQSPSDLARDLRNYLDGKPLDAGPESAAYRVRKYVRRNRGPVATAAAVVLALAAGLSAAVWQAGVAGRERDVAKAAKREASAALEREAQALNAERARTAELDRALTEVRTLLEAEKQRTSELAGVELGLGRSPDDETTLLQLISDNRIDLARSFTKPHMITVHHSGVPFTEDDLEETVRHMREIRTAHIRQGWTDVGYHFIVDPAGRVWALRSLLEQGAHVKDLNPGNVGILVLGDFHQHTVSDACAQAVEQLVSRLCETLAIAPSRVYTHRELSPVDDPGPPLQRTIETARSRGFRDTLNPSPSSDDSRTLAADVPPLRPSLEGVFLINRNGEYFLNCSFRETVHNSPFVGRAEVHVFDRQGEAVRTPELAVRYVALPALGAVWLAHDGTRELPDEALVSRSRTDTSTACCATVRAFTGETPLAKEYWADVSALLDEGGWIRVEWHPDHELAARLKLAGVEVPDQALAHDVESRMVRLQVGEGSPDK